LDEEGLREVYFALAWTSYGGQGLGWSKKDIDELPLGDIQWYLDRVRDQRAAEAAALKKKR
jgi:hypothetical protein